MRVNIYSEELTGEVELIERIAENTGETFIGARLYLKSHEDMYPPKHNDDDSSAVTIWAHNNFSDRRRISLILRELSHQMDSN